jgi:hypothetical protein
MVSSYFNEQGRGRGQGLTPYPPTLRVARHQAAVKGQI